MTNPYQPDGTGGIDTKPTTAIKKWSQRQWLTATASVLAILVLSIISIALIMQAMRLDAEGASLPPRLQADFAATSRSSWIGGIAALVGMVMNVGALVFVRKNKLVVPLALLLVTLVGMIGIAVLFKPG